MSIMNAMWSGVSGLSAEGQALGVVGDNVANSNTVGFKMSRAQFEDVLGGAIGQNNGAGVHMARAQQIFAQGSLMNTGQPTDLALSGDGFFVAKGSLGGVTGNFYTRNGQTTLDKDGNLVNPNGLKMQGYAASSSGGFAPGLSDVNIPTTPLQPKPTTTFTASGNLDSSAAVPAAPWDPQNPGTTSNFSTSTKIYDSLGNAHPVDVYFTKTATGTWDYHAVTDGANVTGGTPGQNTEIATGTLTFDSQGALTSNTLTAGGTVDFTGGAAPGQAVTLNFGTPPPAGDGRDGMVQEAGTSNIAQQKSDGYASGSLTGVEVDGSGIVNGVYSNGEKVPVAQLAVAKFTANDGLGRAGHNLWIETRESGAAAMGPAGGGGRASVVAGALEQSNVDIAAQFVDMIAHQRAFQANSKTITTADEMLQEVVNLKR